jgi:hypothetical protein
MGKSLTPELGPGVRTLHHLPLGQNAQVQLHSADSRVRFPSLASPTTQSNQQSISIVQSPNRGATIALDVVVVISVSDPRVPAATLRKMNEPSERSHRGNQFVGGGQVIPPAPTHHTRPPKRHLKTALRLAPAPTISLTNGPLNATVPRWGAILWTVRRDPERFSPEVPMSPSAVSPRAGSPIHQKDRDP